MAEQGQRRAFHQVTKASLAEIAGEEARSVHTLVSRAMRFSEQSALERTDALRVAAVEALTSRLAAVSHIGEYSKIEVDLPHARHLVKNGVQTGEEVRLALWIAHRDYERGDYGSAREVGEQVLGTVRGVLGDEHPQTLTAMSKLAGTLFAQGHHAGARKLEEQVLEARRRVQGDEHPDTLTAMSNLAQTLFAQGDHAGARQLEEHVLEASRRVVGRSIRTRLTAMNNFLKPSTYSSLTFDKEENRTLEAQPLLPLRRRWNTKRGSSIAVTGWLFVSVQNPKPK